MCWSAYRQIERVLISSSEARLASLTNRLGSLLEESARRIRGEVRQLAADPAVVGFLRQPTDDAHAAATRLLERRRIMVPQSAALALWGPDRRPLLTVGPDLRTTVDVAPPSPSPDAPAVDVVDGTSTDRSGSGPLIHADSQVVFATVAPVVDARRDTLGFLVEYRRLTANNGASQVAGLIGPDATFRIGNADGGLWSDLERVVAAPPGPIAPGTPAERRTPDGTRLLGMAAAIQTTPWVVWVQMPRDAILADARTFLARIVVMGLVCILVGTLSALVLIRRITAPLAEVTRAAEDMAGGDYTRRVVTDRHDELGSLARSFNGMAAQVDAASRALRARAAELEVANAGLRASEARYRQLVDAAHEGICTVDASGTITYANDRLAEMLGYEHPGELAGRSLFDFMDGATAFDRRTRFARRHLGIAETQEVPFRRLDGSIVWTLEAVSSLTDADGGFDGALLLLSDITERRAAEERLRSSERHLRALVENASDMICVLDADGRQRYVSPAQERFIGWSPAELEGRNAFDFIHADDLPRVTAGFAQVLRTPTASVTVRFRFRHKNGAWRELSSIATNLLGDPAVGGIVVNSHDVTDQRALEAQLLQAQKMEAVGQLAGGVAHDFNNLLTVVTSYSGLLLTELPDTQARADVREIRAAADRAAALTRQLLAFSRQQVLEPRVLDVNAVVRDIEKMLGRVLREDVRLATMLSPRLGRVYADPGQLEQVIVNLAVNARDAMPNGGALTIETADVELDDEYARSHPDVTPGPYVLLAVSDTGVGMDDATLARIFEPFFTTKAVGHGTGLGLSTVYGIVKQSGGHVGVYSEPGFGTTFKVYLPRVGAADDVRPRSGAQPIVREGSETILLVEDDPQVRAAARRILTRAGYAVLEAASGEEALLLASQHERIDLLLTDLVMPVMGGRELANHFRARYPRMRTAYMSGYTADAVLRQGGAEPGTVFIPKPFTPQTLTHKLREALDLDSREATRRPAPVA